MLPETRTFRRWMAGALLLLMGGSVLVWLLTRQALPRTIRIATGSPGGLYHRVGETLAETLRRTTGRRVTLIPTQGAAENGQLLEAGGADLAILQDGTPAGRHLALLAPLYPEPILLLSRKGSRVRGVRDLGGKVVLTGPTGSGMATSANRILDHFGQRVAPSPLRHRYCLELLRHDRAAAALVTAGVLNPDLRTLAAREELTVAGVEDAAALARLYPELHLIDLPAGLLAASPRTPPRPLTTVATTALLCAGRTLTTPLVREALRALYQGEPKERIPTLLSLEEARSWNGRPLHPDARSWFDPYGSIGVIANFMESLSAAKELLVALVAGLFLAFRWWRNKQLAERGRELQRLKDRLDAFLQRTVAIERRQMEETDPAALETLLAEVTRIKLEAIDELTHEELRGDSHFAIFLAQCANLIRKIQSKILCAR